MATRSRSGRPAPLLAAAALLLLALAPALPTSAGPTPLYTSQNQSVPLFQNVTAQAGVAANDTMLSPSEIVTERAAGFLNGGRGTCVDDFDGDGDDDIYVVGPGRNQMFRNDGNFTFTDITDAARVGDTGYGMGCASGDLDNDGDADIIATTFNSHIMIYRNNGNLTFSNMTASSGIDPVGPHTGVTIADFDNDGLLDFFLAEYSKANDRVFRNSGNFKFVEKTVSARIVDTDFGFQAIAADYDHDGDQDLYVSNDFGLDTLWQNIGNFTFADVSRISGAFDPGAGMGTAWGDYNNDGDLDIYIGNFDANTLYENRAGSFVNVANASGVDDGWVGWGVVWVDYDNDGYMDVYVANGVVEGVRDWLEPNKLFRNLGNGTFADVSVGSGAETGEVSRGVASGDFNQDGMVDLYLLNNNCPAMMFKNVVQNTNQWLRVNLNGTVSNRDGVGATVTVRVGLHTETQLVAAGSSYLSSNSKTLNFGVGSAVAIDDVTIDWPSGLRQVLRNVAVNQTLTVAETDAEDPVAVASDLTVNQGDTFVLNGTRSTDNVRVANWSWSVDVNGTLVNASGATAPMAIYEPGTFSGVLQVRDIFGRTASTTFSVTVFPYRAVFVDLGPDFSIPEGMNFTFVATGRSTVTPNFEADSVFVWWFDTPAGRVNMTGPSPSHLFAEPGVYAVFVNVSDPQGAMAEDSVNVSVLDATFPLVTATVPAAVDEDVAVLLDASATTDNDPTFATTGSFVWSYPGRAGTVTWTGMTVNATFVDPGVVNLRLTVSDRTGNAVVFFYTVSVRDTTPPVAHAGANRTTLPGTEVLFTASASTDNDATFPQSGRFTWTVHTRAGPVAFDGELLVYNFTEPGTFLVDLDAWDAAGNRAAAPSTITVLVQDIVPPVPNGGGDRTVGLFELAALDASGSTDNDPSLFETGTFLWEFQDGAVRIALPGVTASYTFNHTGSYTVRLTVRDAAGHGSAVTFRISVVDDEAPSLVVAQLPQQLTAGDPLALSATGSTDNVAITTIGWRVQGPLGFDQSLSGAAGSIVLPSPGNYTATVTAGDAAGNSRSLNFTVNVVPRPTTGGGGNTTNNGTGNETNNGTGNPGPGTPPPAPTSPAFDVAGVVVAVAGAALVAAAVRQRRARER